jgi:hypothetical protein
MLPSSVPGASGICFLVAPVTFTPDPGCGPAQLHFTYIFKYLVSQHTGNPVWRSVAAPNMMIADLEKQSQLDEIHACLPASA